MILCPLTDHGFLLIVYSTLLTFYTFVFVRVVCDGNDGDIRLTGGNRTAGEVEVCYEDTWQLVCHENWDERDAAVVCRQLGYSSESRYCTINNGC